MTKNPRVYVHSGKLGRQPLAIVGVGVFAALILGLAYAYLDVYLLSRLTSPLFRLVSNVAAFAGVGFLLGISMAFAAMSAKCRSPVFLRVTGVLTGLLAVYFCWVFFEFALMQSGKVTLEETGIVSLFFSPGLVWEKAVTISQAGWLSHRNGTPTGVVLWFLWVTEALIVIVLAASLVNWFIKGSVFCEPCEEWCESPAWSLWPESSDRGEDSRRTSEPWCRLSESLIRLSIPDQEELRERLSAGNFAVLESLIPAKEGEFPHLIVDAQECPKCRETATYFTMQVEEVRGKKGKTESKIPEASEVFLLPRDELARLRVIADRCQQSFGMKLAA